MLILNNVATYLVALKLYAGNVYSTLKNTHFLWIFKVVKIYFFFNILNIKNIKV